MFNFCWHKWSKWSLPYSSSEVRDAGHFGDVKHVDVVVQDKTCSKCGKIVVKRLRDGEVTGSESCFDE